MKLSILVLDDSNTQRIFIDKQLQLVKNYEITTYLAANREEMYEIISKEKIDVIFCDYFLENETAIEIVKSLKNKGYNFPVIIFSSSEDETIIHKSFAVGAIEFVNKSSINPLLLYTIILKIERLKIEEETRRKDKEDSEFIKYIGNKTFNMYMLLDCDYRILNLNQELVEFFEIPRDKMLMKPVNVIFSKHSFVDSNPLNNIDETLLPSQTILKVKKGCKEFLLLTSISNFKLENEKRFLVVLKDFSKEKEYISTINAQKRRLKLINESVNEAVILSKNGKIIEHNTQAMKMFGYDNSLTNSDLSALFEKNEWDKIRGLITQDDIFEKDLVAKRKDGKSLIVHFQNKPLLQNETLYDVSVIRDITHEKKILQQLHRQKIESEKANAAKTDFLAKISHELRTPLHSIIGFSEILYQEIDGSLNEDQKETVNRITNSSKNLLEMINRLLDFTKIDLGKLKIDRQNTDLNIIIENVQKSVMPLIRNKDVVIELDFEHEEEYAFVDKSQIRQVLLNLVSNALKFCENGKITIKSASNNKFAILKVHDTGIGMTEEELDKIFVAFEQANQSISSKYGGTGLGLNIAKKMVKMNNGRISVESKKDEFTEFTLFFPKTQNAIAKFNAKSAKTEKTRILIVDDDDNYSDIIEKVLTYSGYDVIAINNPLLATKTALDFKPQILITDIMMPVMDGAQVVASFRSNQKLKDIKIITISGYSDPELLKLIDANAKLSKPFKKEKLLNTINKLLNEVKK